MSKSISSKSDNRRNSKAIKKASAENRDKKYTVLMQQLSYVKPSGRYSRDELNER